MARHLRQRTTAVAILGAGRLGTVLGAALARRGYRIGGLSCRTRASAEESRRIIGQGEAGTDNAAAAAGSRTVIITVPDDAVSTVAEELAASPHSWQGVCVLHCSGLHPSRILDPLAFKGAAVASFHPVQAFPSKRSSPDLFEKIFFGLEGDAAARAYARRIIGDLGGWELPLRAEQKPLYHTACSMASNLLVPLFSEAAGLLRAAGIPPERAPLILMPLAQGTLQNVKEIDSGTEANALTGPIVRGDASTVEAHLAALIDHPQALAVYRRLGRAALEMARRQRRIPEPAYLGLRTLLEDK